MPFEWNGLIVVTKDELVPNWYKWDNLKKIIQRYQDKPTGIKRVQLGGNGRPMLVHFDTLPSHIKHGIGDPRDIVHVFEKYYRRDNQAVSFYTKHRLPDGSYLEADSQDKYIINASVLKTVITFKVEIEKERKRKGLNTLGIDKVLLDHAITFKKTLKVKHKTEHTLPESLKRFKEVLKDFEKLSYESLISGKHGNDNSRKLTLNTMALLEGMFAKDSTKPTATEVHRRYLDFLSGKIEVINNTTGEVYSPKDFKALSDTTIKKYLSEWSSAIGTNALRSGDRQKFMQKFKPYHSLDKPKFAGSIISIDDRQPPFKMPDGKRLWFYVGIDLASGAVVCWVYGKTKEGIILEFYRKLVRNYAEWGLCLPNELECEMSLNSSFKDTFLREGVMFQDVRIEANNARGKRIEAHFRQLRYAYEKKREGWIARPFAISESNQTGKHEVKEIPYDDIVEGCEKDFVTWNNDGHVDFEQLSKWEYFIQNQHPGLKPINYNAILLYLGYKTTTSCNTGIIKLQYSEFLLGENGEVCTDRDRLISLMKRIEGHSVDVYWLDDNQGKVLKALVYIGSLLICEAVPKPTYNRAKIEQTADDHRAQEIMSKYVAIIEAYGKSRKRAIEGVVIVNNTEPTKKTFTMPGLKPSKAFDMPTGELMPEPEDDYELMPQQSVARPLKDRI